ncbi:MAG: hypothetical protein E6G19_05265 [Actinobacteria bacterium]|nr:MAG: hypothetical protein E6G19_05265 [Actinomycetota bacterium]
MENYGVIDLSTESPVQVTAEGEAFWAGKPGGVDLGKLRSQLEEIRDAILPVAAGPDGAVGGFGLQTLEIDLTIGAEGQVWFVAKGSLEASIKLTFGHPAAAR